MSEKIEQLNEEVIKGQIKELVRGSVEETLNWYLLKCSCRNLQEWTAPESPCHTVWNGFTLGNLA